jgi:hypothetical protein
VSAQAPVSVRAAEVLAQAPVSVRAAEVSAQVPVSVRAAEVSAQAPVSVRAAEGSAQVPVPVRAAVVLVQVPVRWAEPAWEMESARAALAREGALVWVAKAAGQVEALAPGLEEEAAVVGVPPPESPASERR